MFGIPSNVLPLFLAGFVVIIFGLRGFLHHKKVKSPLVLYYAWSGLLFGFSGIFYSLPFALTNSDIVLKITVTIADILYM